jgi:hypothetical protein
MDGGPYPDIRFESYCNVVPVIAFGWTPHRTQLSHVPFRTVTVLQLPNTSRHLAEIITIRTRNNIRLGCSP